MKKYIVKLTSEERKQLQQLVQKGKVAGYKIRHAQMLLKADQGNKGRGWPDAQVASKFGNSCPVRHPSFDTGKCYGCTKYLDVTDDARSKFPRDSKKFKEIFKDRQIVEQYFSRLGDREVEQTTHYSFTAISNQMTIAHLSASLIAVAAAVILKQPDRIRCYRTFARLPKTG